MFVAGATALGIAVLVGGGTAGIQTPLPAPAAGASASAASSVEEGRAEPSPLSVRVMKPSRGAATGDRAAVLSLAFADVVDFDPSAVAHKARKPARPTVLVDPAAAPPVVLAAAPAPPVVAVAAPVTKAAAKTAAKAKSPKVGPPLADIGVLGALTSEYRTERAQTPKKAKDKGHKSH